MENQSYINAIEIKIQDFISNINFKKDFDIKSIKEQIANITKSIPSVTIQWKSNVILNEDKTEKSKMDIVNGINIVWLDSDSIPHNLKYIV